MRWVTRNGKAKIRERAEKNWHKIYALWPRKVPEIKADGIVVPEHRVWLDYVDRRLEPEYQIRYEYRPHVPHP